jgi:glycosyltransferase involved in cell wall biosynthesis
LNYILIHSINSLGGAERVLQKVLVEFSQEEYTLVVLEKNKPGQYYEDFDALNVITLSEKNIVSLSHSFLLIYSFLKGISAVNDRVIGFLWRAYIPTSILSIFLSLNRSSFYIMEHLVPEHYSKIFHYLLRFSFSRASRIFFVSDYALKGFNVSNGEVLYNYLDTRKQDLQKSRTEKIIWVGRNCYQKNIGDLISFAKVNEKYSIDVFGFNDYRSQDFPNNISIHGKVNEIDYSSYQFLLITSHYESQALVIHEALNNGLSVICRKGLYPFVQEFYPKQSLLLYNAQYTWQPCEDNVDYVWRFNDISIDTWKKLLTK